MRKRLKMLIITATIMASMVVQVGCSRDKSLTLVNDVAQQDPITMKENIKVEEKILDLSQKDVNDFQPSYFEGNKIIGMVLKDSDVIGSKPTKEKKFSEMDGEGNVKESEKKAAYAIAYNGIKGVTATLNEGNIYYYDFTNGKDEITKIITVEELYPENKKGQSSYYNMWKPTLVKGNDKYMEGYGFRSRLDTVKKVTGLKLFDIENKKLYHSEPLYDMMLSDILYIKGLDIFVVVDDQGQVYKLIMNNSKLELEKMVKIPIGDGNIIQSEFRNIGNFDVEIVDDNSIAITNIGKRDEAGNLGRANILVMTYNFKSGQISNVVENKTDEYIRIKEYYPKHNLALISKGTLEDKNKIQGAYIAKIDGTSIKFIHKLEDNIKEDEDEIFINSLINEEGDKLFISQKMLKKGNPNYLRRTISICNIK